MPVRRLITLSLVASSMMVAGAAARDRDGAPAKRADLLQKVVDCRAIGDGAQRLACFDASVEALDKAERADQIVVMDRAQVREARRSLFGFSLPKIRLFGGEGDKDEVDHIDTAVTGVTRDANNALIFTTTEGARWHQLDDGTPFGVRAGTKVTIKKATLGSYFAKFAGTIAIRVRRDN